MSRGKGFGSQKSSREIFVKAGSKSKKLPGNFCWEARPAPEPSLQLSLQGPLEGPLKGPPVGPLYRAPSDTPRTSASIIIPAALVPITRPTPCQRNTCHRPIINASVNLPVHFPIGIDISNNIPLPVAPVVGSLIVYHSTRRVYTYLSILSDHDSSRSTDNPWPWHAITGYVISDCRHMLTKLNQQTCHHF